MPVANKAQNYQQTLDITVREGEEVYLQVDGTHDIYVTGNYIAFPEDDDEDEEDEYDEEYDELSGDDELDIDEMDEDEEDELDNLENPRITEVDSEEEAPALVAPAHAQHVVRLARARARVLVDAHHLAAPARRERLEHLRADAHEVERVLGERERGKGGRGARGGRGGWRRGRGRGARAQDEVPAEARRLDRGRRG